MCAGAFTTQPTCLCGTLVLGLLLVTPMGWADPSGGGAPTVETRVFDIRPLLLEVPDYRAVFSDMRSDDLYNPPGRQFQNPYPGGESTPPQAEAGPDAVRDRREKNTQVLMEMIRNIIAPRTWRPEGGDVGVMYFYAGQLVVSHTPTVTAEIERLLNLLKATRSLKLRLEAYFVLVPTANQERAPFGELLSRREFAADEFRKHLESHAQALEVIRVSLSAFEGQRVFTTAGRQFSVLVGAQPVVDSATIGYEPITRQLVSGVTLEAQSVLDQDQGTVLIDLRAALGDFCVPPGGLTAPADSLAILAALPPYQIAHFATSLSLPVDRFSLIGTARYDEGRDVVLFAMPSRE